MRSWPVIPAMGVAAAGAALGLAAARGVAPAALDVVAVGACGAAVTAAIRALVGDSAASLVGAVLAPLLLVATLADPALALHATARGWIAIAAFAWTLVELARPTTSPLVALLPACTAAVLDPSFVPLLPVAGARLVTAPWRRPRWAIAVPIVGGLVVVLAVLACGARSGALGALGDRWCGLPAASMSLPRLAALAATTLGPITAVAALAGLIAFARPRHADLAALACLLAATLVGLRTGVLVSPLVGFAALSAGLAVGRFAATIRLASGQAIVGALAAAMLVLPPAWIAIAHAIAAPQALPQAHASR